MPGRTTGECARASAKRRNAKLPHAKRWRRTNPASPTILTTTTTAIARTRKRNGGRTRSSRNKKWIHAVHRIATVLPLRRFGGMLVARRQAAALKLPAHGAVPAITGHHTANRQHDDVDVIERSAPPQHPADPQNREGDSAQFQ